MSSFLRSLWEIPKASFLVLKDVRLEICQSCSHLASNIYRLELWIRIIFPLGIQERVRILRNIPVCSTVFGKHALLCLTLVLGHITATFLRYIVKKHVNSVGVFPTVVEFVLQLWKKINKNTFLQTGPNSPEQIKLKLVSCFRSTFHSHELETVKIFMYSVK